MRRSPIPALIGALAAATSLAEPAAAHVLVAQGSDGCNSAELCFDTHLEGHYTDGGVPGVDLNYSFFDTSVDSDNGHSSIDAGWSWLEGTTPPHSNEMTDVIEENLDLVRIAPGPITVRATLGFRAAAQGAGAGAQTSALVSFNGCQVYVQQNLFPGFPSDPQVIGNCGAQSTAAELIVTQTYDGQPPTHPLLRTQLQVGYASIQKNDTVAVQAASDLHFEVSNATTSWDTPTFLTQAPEPGATAAGVAAGGAIAGCARARRRRWR